jgi:hypothetical protein
MVTKPLVFAGGPFVLNYSTSAAGSIRVEVQDADGTPIPGFTLDEFPERYGDEIEGVMKWESGADVYSLRFGEPTAVADR